MTQSHRYTTVEPDHFTASSLAREQFALDVLMGFSSEHKWLPTKYFYNDVGSQLYQEITATDEYYLTGCELEILQAHKADLAQRMAGGNFNLVELGAGDGHKTEVLLRELQSKGVSFRYVPIDISEAAVDGLTAAMAERLPDIETHGLVGDYFDGIRWLSSHHPGPACVLFLGSTIGNFTRPATLAFLRTLWKSLHPDDLVLIGFDLKKDIDVLLHAYNDSAGATSRFNLNVLARINAELDADINVDSFRHFGTYDVFAGAMKSYLVSNRHQTINVRQLNKSFEFKAYEPIHLEYSFKFLPEQITQLAHDTGFEAIDYYTDSKNYFTDALWKVTKHL